MISSFEVGAVFKIVNEASPALTKMLRQVRELTTAVDKARASLAELSKGVGSGAGLSAAIGETKALSAEWKGVAENAAKARVAMAAASGAVRTPSLAAGGGRGALGNRLGMHGGGGGAHIGPGVAMPGGGHVRFGGGAGLATLGAVGYGVYEAMQYDDAVTLMATHAGVDLATNRARFRKMLTDAAVQTGYGEHDVSAAAQQELRLFANTGGSNGVDVLPKMLRYAAVEARRKGTSLEESMESMVGLAHMLHKYNEADVDKLAPAFSVLSTRNPMSLKRQETAFGYAVPLLQSLGMDPYDVMAASTALARAGINSTKAGTWIREAAVRSMPGTSMMSKIAFKKHEEGLRAFGLIDDHDKPTWFVDGKPNLTKMLDIVAEHAKTIPIAKRAGYERAVFGAQGSGAVAVLGDDAVREQMHAMVKTVSDSRELNNVRNWMTLYGEQSSMQNARTAIQTFNVTMADIGDKTLPAVNHALGDFKSILEKIRSVLPRIPGAGGLVGARFMEGATGGAAAGAVIGMAGGPIGALGGAAIGSILGTAEGFMESYSGKQSTAGIDPGGSFTSPGATGKPAQLKAEVKMQTEINLDGQKLASAISQYLIEALQWSTSAPNADGMGIYDGGGQ